MKQVIRIPDDNDKQEKVLKPVEFTHVLDGFEGWDDEASKPRDYEKIVYLGKCEIDGDMFVGYEDDCINIFKGHLNDGVY